MSERSLGPEPAVEIAGKSVGALMWLKFKRSPLAKVGLGILIFLYVVTFLSEFFAPYALHETFKEHENQPPTVPRFVDEEGRFHLRPFVYGHERHVDFQTFKVTWMLQPEQRFPLYLFISRGDKYRLGPLPVRTNLRLFGVREGYVFLFGTDRWGRDTLSRVLYGGRISMSIGLVGVTISLVLGIIIGTASGYFAGAVDLIVQRIIEVLQSVPTLPLWILLAASLPKELNQYQRYFAIVVVLSIIGWTGLARSVRGMILANREAQYILAARNIGAGTARILLLHLTPNIMSFLLVNVTLSIPNMIIGETSLSFLGLGIRPPMTSWGALLQEAQSVQNMVNNPWYLIPGLFVIVAVLCFNFVGDGLRDAADPFSHR